MMTHLLSKLGIFISSLLISATVLSQTEYGDPTAQYTKRHYKSDFRQYVRLLKKNHPQKYAFISRKELNTLKKLKLQELSDSTSLGQFFWDCQDIAASIQCAHTYVWWPEGFGPIPDSLLFPLDTWTDGEKLFVTDARNNTETIDQRAEILRINNVEVKAIIEAMYASSSSDGNIESAKKNWINHMFHSLCPMYFNYPQHYSVHVKMKNGQVKTVPLEKFQRNTARTYESKAPLHLELDSIHSLGVLAIHSFNYYEDDFAEFKSFIDRSFDTLNKTGIEYLVIDLRSNMGGDSKCGSYLIEHIADQAYCYWPINNDATWQKDLHQIIQPNEHRFKGKSYVFIDGGCLSTSGHVGSIIKENAFGILVGEEMGSTYICNDNSLLDSLNHTGLRYSIPRTIFSTCVSNFPRDKGVLPDIEIVPSLDDVINQSDPLMEYVLRDIERKD